MKNVITFESVTGAQSLVEVKVNVTVPAVVSVVLGTYVAFNVVASGVNVPLPLVVHIPVVVPPVTLPFNGTVRLAQTLVSLPALTKIFAAKSEKKPMRTPVAAAPLNNPSPNLSVELTSLIFTPCGT